MVTATLLQVRQKQLYEQYEALLAMGRDGLNSEEEEQVLRRLDWWDYAENEYRKNNPNQLCIWGDQKICGDAVVCCWYCAATGKWRNND